MGGSHLTFTTLGDERMFGVPDDFDDPLPEAILIPG